MFDGCAKRVVPHNNLHIHKMFCVQVLFQFLFFLLVFIVYIYTYQKSRFDDSILFSMNIFLLNECCKLCASLKKNKNYIARNKREKKAINKMKYKPIIRRNVLRSSLSDALSTKNHHYFVSSANLSALQINTLVSRSHDVLLMTLE